MTDILDTRPDTTAVTRSPLDDARSQLADAIKVLGYDQGMYDLLAAPRRELTVSIPLRRDDDSVEIITGHRCSTTTPAGRPRAACATARTSTSTRSARWRCG
jgi:glutamate dehydrogenase/leucine dehydrogenase